MRRIAQAVAATLGLALGACDLLPDWLGKPEAPPLPGVRISVLELDALPQADPNIADLAVRLPRPRLNPDWPQVGGYADHSMQHLEAPGSLAPLWTVDIGEGVSDERRMLSPPVVADGQIYALDPAGSTVVRVEARSGTKRCRTALEIASAGRKPRRSSSR